MNSSQAPSGTRRWFAAMMIVVIFMVLSASALAQAPDGEPTVTAEPKPISLWSTVKAGGVVGFLIILMSLISVALVIEHFLSIRRDRFLPETLIEQIDQHLENKAYPEAQEACSEDGSFLGLVIGAGLNQLGAMFGFFDMQNAMQEVSERQVSKLYRKLDYLSFIAATSPMLGLLGTVTGMIRSFNQIAMTEGSARPSQLAGGISEALVTTCMGLVVAIPTMFFVSLFRNRIDGYVAEAESVVEKLMGRFRKTST